MLGDQVVHAKMGVPCDEKHRSTGYNIVQEGTDVEGHLRDRIHEYFQEIFVDDNVRCRCRTMIESYNRTKRGLL